MRQRHKWTDAENEQLRMMWILFSVAHIARTMNRSEAGVRVRAKRLGLRSVEHHERLLTVTPLALVLGVDVKTAWGMMQGRLAHLVVEVWRYNSPTPAVPLARLVVWVGDPLNWYCFDPDKVQHGLLKTAVAKARTWWRDAWWTVPQACEELAVSAEWLNGRLRHGLIAGRKYGHNWRVLRSTILAVKQELWTPVGWMQAMCDDVGIEKFKHI